MHIARWLTKSLLRTAVPGADKTYDTERSRLPEHRVGHVWVHGHSVFAAEVKQALAQLESAYPYGFSLVQRYIRAIVQSNINPNKGTANGVIYRKCNSDGSLGIPVNSFAAALVRRAVATRKLLRFHIWRSPRSALGSLNQELRAMRLLQCDPKYFHRQTNKILKLERQLKANRR
jgi:hypothetical protein